MLPRPRLSRRDADRFLQRVRNRLRRPDGKRITRAAAMSMLIRSTFLRPRPR